MYDMAFTERTLRQQVRRIDFLNYPALRIGGELDDQIKRAVDFVSSPVDDLKRMGRHRVGKAVVRCVSSYHTALALRKLNANIVHIARLRPRARDAIARSLSAVLSECVPYRIYKLDIRRFFESIDPLHIQRALDRAGLHHTVSARLVADVLNAHHADGGEGLPRGLAISGTLADLVLCEFDARCEDHNGVFFYRRYVDDITLVTSAEEDAVAFVAHLSHCLPVGLQFKQSKIEIREAAALPAKPKATSVPRTERIDYLGYAFRFDAENLPALACGHRKLHVDIARKKVCKIKTRIIKALLDCVRAPNFDLLDDRLRHLTSNLSMPDRSSGLSRLVGIHFNYSLVDASQSEALAELDRFLQHALNSSEGRVFKRVRAILSPAQRARLSRHSFVEGAKTRRFFQMGLKKLGVVQGCWKYA